MAFEQACAKLNIEASIVEIQTANDIDAAMATLIGQTDALYVYSEPLTNANKSKIIKAAIGAKIPTICGFREFVDAGGLISLRSELRRPFRTGSEITRQDLAWSNAS